MDVVLFVGLGGIVVGTWVQLALSRHRHEMFTQVSRHRHEVVVLLAETLMAVTDPALRKERSQACAALGVRHMDEMRALMQKHDKSAIGRLIGTIWGRDQDRSRVNAP
jgi:hypothetical protein